MPATCHHFCIESDSAVALKFINTGGATAVFQVRSGNPADVVRTYTVEPGKQLSDTWNGTHGRGAIALSITNVADVEAEITLLDAYTGKLATHIVQPHQTLEDGLPLDEFGGWYDLLVKVPGDASFKYQLAGHVETGKDSISDPALGGLVTLKGQTNALMD